MEAGVWEVHFRIGGGNLFFGTYFFSKGSGGFPSLEDRDEGKV